MSLVVHDAQMIEAKGVSATSGKLESLTSGCIIAHRPPPLCMHYPETDKSGRETLCG